MSTLTGRPLGEATVLLCGASGGLGEALARELHARGAVLTLVGRDANRVNSVPVPGHRLVADLREPDACHEAVELAAEATGGLDVLVNAVGVVAFGPVSELPPAAMSELLDTNALVPMLLASAALPRMRPGGAIVNVSGIVAEPGRAMAGMAAYAASKAAVRAFDQALAREARRVKVRVLDARPPHTETGLAARAIAGRAPALPPGLPPDQVARVICDALEVGAGDLPSEAFNA